MKNDEHGKTEKALGASSRIIRRYMGKQNQEPFKWLSLVSSYNREDESAGKKVLSLREATEMQGVTFEDAFRKMRNIKLRGFMYMALTVIFTCILMYSAASGGVAPFVMMASLVIPLLFSSFAIRLLFWAAQIQEGLKNPEQKLVSFSVYLRSPSIWF